MFKTSLTKWILGLLVTAWTGFILYNLVTDPFMRSHIGNRIYNQKSSDTKLTEGKEKCQCPPLNLSLGISTTQRFDQIIRDLNTTNLKIKRILQFTVGRKNPYLTTLVPSSLDYKKGEVNRDYGKQKIKVKLTGGQVDHWDTERVSLRIKSDSAVIGSLQKLNLYNPKSRNGGVYEWFGHELLKDAGLIPLETGYVDVSINEINKGIYFYQEQPSVETLIKSGNRPGLIVRPSQWVDFNKEKNHIDIVNYYGENDLSEDEFENYNAILQNKIIDINAGLIGAGEIYNLEKMARFSAVIDLINGYHAGFWNIYFYFNPTDSLLEPIGREFSTNYYVPCFEFEYPFVLKRSMFNSNQIDNGTNIFISNQLLLNEDEALIFKKNYYTHLSTISTKEYLDVFIESRQEEINARQYCLYKANPDYPEFYLKHYFDNQILIQKMLRNEDILESKK